jgi:hypothetical protein
MQKDPRSDHKVPFMKYNHGSGVRLFDTTNPRRHIFTKKERDNIVNIISWF